MTQNPDDLDRVIDSVAKRLTDVEEDSRIAERIMASLTERMTWFGWLTTSWAPRLAGLVLMAGVSAMWMNRPQPAASMPHLSSSQSSMVAKLRPTVEPFAPLLRSTPLEPLEPLKPLEPSKPLDLVKPDFQFSLRSLDVEALPPMMMAAAESIDLAPLALHDLPLSGEFAERDKE